MIAVTRQLKFRFIAALMVLSVAINLYFYFYNRQYLPYILYFAIFFMAMAASISYLNAQAFRTKNSLGRVWKSFAIALAIWTFTNGVSTIYVTATNTVFPYFWSLVIIDIIGYLVFAYASIQLLHFVDLIKTSNAKVPLARLFLLATLASLILLGGTLTYLYFRLGTSDYLFTIYLLADMIIAGSMLFPLMSLSKLSIQRPFALFIFGFVLLILAEASYYLFVILGIYQFLYVGSPQHFLYLIAFGFFALGAYDQKRQLA
ncbi:MAG: hypothetical protein HYT70_03800 [Candidatus Aenigmarchaeota archaeon]|nr:hypothetical protein [Candidatus Aenigmarchaeota archaeon]